MVYFTVRLHCERIYPYIRNVNVSLIRTWLKIRDV